MRMNVFELNKIAGAVLATALAVLAVLYYLCVYLGGRLAGSSHRLMESAGRLVYAIIPISLVFHFAHYLTQLPVNFQYVYLAFNDPFSLDWNVLGVRDFRVTTSFLYHLDSVASILRLQTVIIVAGHVVGITVAHTIALNLYDQPGKAITSQVFLAVLMVVYTAFGLWLLSTPAIG